MTKKRSFKKSLVFVLVLAVILALVGCVRYETKMSVGTNKKINITLLYAEYAELGSSDSKQDQVDAMKANGWSVVDYKDNEYSGWEMAKQGIDFDDLEKELKATGFGFDSFSFTEKDGVYTMTWDFSDSLNANSTKSSDLSSLGQMGGFMRFYLSLPDSAIEENATTVTKNGTRLEWDLTKLNEPILVKFSLPDPNAQGIADTDDDDKDTDPSDTDDTTAAPGDSGDNTTPSDPGKTLGKKSAKAEEDAAKEAAKDALLPFLKDLSYTTMQWIMIISWSAVAVLLVVIVVLIVLLVKSGKKDKKVKKKVQEAAEVAPVPQIQQNPYPTLPNPYGMNQYGQQGTKPPFSP